MLLIRRADRGVWGLPGRHVDPSENAIRAAARELAEEAGVRVDELGVAPEVVTRECVDDWRNTDHAWVATTVVLWRVPQPVTSAAEAGWFPFSSLADLDQATGGQLYDAHRPLLEQVLKRL